MKKVILSETIAVLAGLVLTGVLASLLGDKLGPSVGIIYLYSRLVHERITKALKKRIK